jgi:O-antigen ligase
MPNGYRSVFDAWFNIQRTSEQLMRSSATFPHPNILGGFLFCTLLNTFYLYFTEKKYKFLFLSGITLQMLALTVSFSRAAFIALFLSTALYFLFQARSPEKRPSIKQLILTLLISFALCLALFYPQLLSRGGIINYNALVQGADTERLAYQKIAIDMIKERPLLGIGLNNFQIESHRFFPEGRMLPSKVHNIYLLFAAETGLLGGSCFLLFLFSILKNIRRSFQSPQGLFLFSLFSGLLFIGACDFYFISTPHGRILFFGFAALLYTASYGKIDEKSTCTA